MHGKSQEMQLIIDGASSASVKLDKSVPGKYMQQLGLSKDEGVSILVRNNLHREIHRNMKVQDPALSARDALAQNTLRVREVYRQHDLYLPNMKRGLLELIQQNKIVHPKVFKKLK